MTRSLTRLAAVLAIASTAVLISACSSPATEAAPEPSTTTSTVLAEAPVAESESTQKPDAAATDTPTCETIISTRTVEDFESLGWTTLTDVFVIGSAELAGGLQCVWGDFEGAPEQVQVFGWAPITDAQAATAESELVADGWAREDGADGVYVTMIGADTPVDDEGYGPTYLIGDGWIKFADTKQGLILVSWPQS